MINIFSGLKAPASPITKTGLLALLILAQLFVYWLVYTTGGIRFVYSHSMYVPIVLGGALFGTWGGILLGVTGGLILGPFMPINTTTGEMQVALNWLYRLMFFALIGGLVGALSDRVRRYVRKIEWELSHNPSSGLPNRYALIKSLESKPGMTHRLYLIHLKNLADLETTLGHSVQKKVVNSIKHMLEDSVNMDFDFFHPKSDNIAILVFKGMHHSFEEFEQKLEEVIPQLIEYHHIPLVMEYLYGCIDIDGNFVNSEDYLRKTEISLLHAKENNRNKFAYEPEAEDLIKRNVELLGQFKHSLSGNKEIFLNYQPKYLLEGRGLNGAEVLLRWHNAKWGIISPGVFIPLIENSQLVNEMTYFVLQKTLDTLDDFARSELPIDRLAVNISTANLMSTDFTGKVRDMITARGIDPRKLEFEITETALLDSYEICRDQLIALSEIGICITLDDYGTGYSSLHHISELPLDVIKIDQVFIKNLVTNRNNQKIVTATIDLAHNLGCEVVAEGIEDQATEDMLQELGCDCGQGFYFARPADLSRLQGMMAQLA